jgi:integrase/recombinase XerD
MTDGGKIITPAEWEVIAGGGEKLSPALSYLASLGSSESRRVMASALDRVAAMMGAANFREVPWERIRYEHVAMLRAKLSGEAISMGHANLCLVAVRRVSLHGMRLGIIDPGAYQQIAACEGIKGTRLPKGRFLDGGEIMALYGATHAASKPLSGLRDRAFLGLCWGMGLRVTEAINVAAQEVTGEALRVTGKGNKEREVPWAPNVQRHLVKWCESAAIESGAVLRAVNKFGTVAPGSISAVSLRRICEQLADASGVARFTPHDLRATYATMLLESGVDALIVQRLLGHARVDTVQTYDRRPATAARAAVNYLLVPAA